MSKCRSSIFVQYILQKSSIFSDTFLGTLSGERIKIILSKDPSKIASKSYQNVMRHVTVENDKRQIREIVRKNQAITQKLIFYRLD